MLNSALWSTPEGLLFELVNLSWPPFVPSSSAGRPPVGPCPHQILCLHVPVPVTTSTLFSPTSTDTDSCHYPGCWESYRSSTFFSLLLLQLLDGLQQSSVVGDAIHPGVFLILFRVHVSQQLNNVDVFLLLWTLLFWWRPENESSEIWKFHKYEKMHEWIVRNTFTDNSLLQFGPEVSLQHCLLLLLHMKVGVALDLSMLVGGDTPVLTRVWLGHLSDLQFGLLALLLDGDPAAMHELPPLPLHPLYTGDGVSTNFGDEGGGALCGTTDGGLKQQSVIKLFTTAMWCKTSICPVYVMIHFC